MTSVDPRHLKRPLVAVGAAAALFSIFFALMIAFVLWREHDRPQFPYELVMGAAGAIYFGALFGLTWRGLRHVGNEADLPRTLQILSQAVLGMFVPVAALAAFLLWLVFQPAY